MAKYKFYVSTGNDSISKEETIEIPDKELKGLTEDVKNDYIYEVYFLNWLLENVNIGFHEE